MTCLGRIINSYIGKNFFLTTLMPLIYFEQVCSSSTLLSSNGARCQGEGMGLVASHASSAILAICSYRLLMRQSLLFGRLMAGASDGEGHCSGSGVVAVQANAAEGHY